MYSIWNSIWNHFLVRVSLRGFLCFILFYLLVFATPSASLFHWNIYYELEQNLTSMWTCIWPGIYNTDFFTLTHPYLQNTVFWLLFHCQHVRKTVILMNWPGICYRDTGCLSRVQASSFYICALLYVSSSVASFSQTPSRKRKLSSSPIVSIQTTIPTNAFPIYVANEECHSNNNRTRHFLCVRENEEGKKWSPFLTSPCQPRK